MQDRESPESVKLAATAIVSAILTATLVIAVGGGGVRHPAAGRQPADKPVPLVRTAN